MYTTEFWNSIRQTIISAESLARIDILEQELFGRKAGHMTLALKEVGILTEEERKIKGKELNAVKVSLTEALAQRKAELGAATLTSRLASDTLDLSLSPLPPTRGHLHLIHEFIREAEEVFGRMGFDTATGPEVETEDYQFNLLNFPKHHAARDSQDIFYIHGSKDPENRLLLRGHTSTVQLHYMQEHTPPLRMICTGKVYRKDSDATHSPMFHQIEGLMVGKDVSMANMKAVMEQAVRELISPDAEFRWRTGYFPFVEPGLEMDMRWRGDESKSREGRWLEIVGCGMVHPNVLQNAGIDPKVYQGFAFGFGVERMIMIRHQIPDLRLLFEGDMRFIRQF